MQMTSTTQQVQVQVPAGVGPGGAIEFSNPMAPGQMLGLSVPAGMKAGDTFAVTLPASQALPYQAGPPAGGQPHQVLIQMQGVPTSAVIPAIDHEGRRMSAGGRFTVATANGQTVLVNCKGFAPGQQIQFMSAPMVGVPTAPRPPDDTAVAQYEQLLAGVTQIIVQDMRRCNEPTVEMAALRMFGKTAGGSVGLMGTLYLVINEASPSHTSRLPPKDIEIADHARDSGSAELQLSDGRVVMQLSNPEWRGAQIAQEVAEKRRKDWLRPEVQMMDREDLVRVTDETVRSDSWCSDCAPPLDSLPQTRVSHPHSTDETLKQGFQQVAPASANSQTIVRGKLGVFCCPIAFLLAFTPIPAPDVHYQLQEVRSGNTVEGVLYTQKGRSYFHGAFVYEHGRGGGQIPDGDTLVFNERVPLQVRKDMLAVLVHRITFNALGGMPEKPPDPQPAHTPYG